MRILVVQESDWLSRNPHQQHHLMERLVGRGHQVKVIDYAIDWKKDNNRSTWKGREIHRGVSKIIPGAGIEVLRPPALHISYLEYFALLFFHKREILKQIQEWHPDVIVGLGILNAWVAAHLSRRYHIPFVYYWIDALDTLIPNRWFRQIGRIIEEKTIGQSQQVLTINQRLMDYVLALGAEPETTSVIGAGIDINRFDPSIDGSKLRLKYKIRPDDIVLFFMGWLYHFSGLKEVTKELIENNGNPPRIVLLIVGDGDAYEDLIGIRDEFKIGDRLILAGKHPYESMPEFIAASDICILPADPHEVIMQNIVPIKIYEYMAMERPVICTKLPGIYREFGQGNGIIYISDPVEVIEKARDMMDVLTRREYGRKARNFVEFNDWDTITKRFEKKLKTTINKG